MSATSLQVGAQFMISTGDQFYQSNNDGTYKTAFEGVVNLTDPRYSDSDLHALTERHHARRV